MARFAARMFLPLVAVLALSWLTADAEADVRQYYGGWAYHPQQQYYYRNYYYKPTVNHVGYNYHYCIYRPSTPRYVYYYNPHRRVYWGRFDLDGKPGAQYSLLEDKDRKGSLSEIPESAFPTPGAMPGVPDAEDDLTIEPPQGVPSQDLPASGK